MVRMTHWDPGTLLDVQTPIGRRPARVRDSFWA
jgi:dimethylsulfoniopropionate demethylase